MKKPRVVQISPHRNPPHKSHPRRSTYCYNLLISSSVSQGKNTSGRSGRDIVNVESLSMHGASVASRIPQQDGIHDGFEDLLHMPGVANEDYNTPVHQELHGTPNIGTPNIGTPNIGTPKPPKSETGEDDEPPLNEDDDDDDDLDDFDQADDEPSTHHLVLAQFDKVTRTKSRWKCTLKDGIMHINSKDILFNKATGEFEF